MKITVRVKARSREERVERIDQPSLGLDHSPGGKVMYKVSVKEAPVDGEANEAVARALAEYFDVSPSRVILVSGHAFREKVFEIS